MTNSLFLSLGDACAHLLAIPMTLNLFVDLLMKVLLSSMASKSSGSIENSPIVLLGSSKKWSKLPLFYNSCYSEQKN